jgi:hypothetical protein
VPVAITVEGANILTRSLIIFGQGAIRCHPYVLAKCGRAEDTPALRRIRRSAVRHIGYTGRATASARW